ncbi:Protein RecA [Planctomycetes bacterium Pan216]|uniref:Protein RecA n=1 Tax=Kolteria novifilia TaxID=2527975 RepID=A0A518B3P6_9BACT|nr:Protein RecA [Planctomycetes bacterium Pan216]
MASNNGSTNDKALKSTLQLVEKQFGKGSIMKLGASQAQKIDGISSGALSLDLALGGAGVPRGRIVELFGPESSGKTTIALHVVAEAQRAGGVAAFVDAEHALDPSWAKRVGVDIENLLVSQPSSAEEALQITEMLVKSDAVDIIVIDSVAALVPRAELEGEMGDSHVGLQARLMSQALRKLTGALARSRTVLVFINQIRQKIGVMFGNPETTTGGLGLKFYSSCRIDVRRISQIKDGDEVVGSRIRAKVVKNKIAPPFRTAEFDLMYNEGVSREGDVIDLGIADRIIGKSGSWLSYGDIRLGQGRENAKNFLRESPEIFSEIRDKILQKRSPAPAQAAEESPPVESDGARVRSGT